MKNLMENLKEFLVTSNNDELLEVNKLINNEVHIRHNNGSLKGHFKPGELITFTDDDGCRLFGAITSNEEIILPNPENIFIKSIDPKTELEILAISPSGNFIPTGVPMLNEAQIFKYILGDEDGNHEN